MMKVTMAVVSDLSTDARVRKQAFSLARAGWQVEVIGFHRRREAATELANGVRFRCYYLPQSGDSPRLVRIGRIAFSVLRAMSRIIRSDADVYVTHNLHLSLAVMVSACLRSAPVIYDAHEIETIRHAGLFRSIVRKYEKFVWRITSAQSTTNISRANFLRELYGGEAPVVLNNYPDTSNVGIAAAPNLRKSLGVPPASILLIFQGGFYLRERDFLTVARGLRERPNWHWVLIGFGGRATIGSLEAIIEATDIRERVSILPPVPAEHLLAYTKQCDVGVVPLNRYDENNYLGDTNKLFEYLVSGLPVIGSDFPEIRRALFENDVGIAGALYEPENVASFVNALDDVAKGLQAYRTCADALRDRFSWSFEEPKLLDLYTSVIMKRGVRPE